MSAQKQTKSTKISSRKKTASRWTKRRITFVIAGCLVLVIGVVGAASLILSRAGSQDVAKEDFTSSAANFTTVAGGQWSTISGQYVLRNALSPADPNVGNANYAIHKTIVTGDFTYNLDFIVPNDPGSSYDDASVIVDWQDSNNYVYASFNEKTNDYTNGLFTIRNGVQTKIATFSKTQQPDLKHHVMLNKAGSVYSVYLDGVKIGSGADASFGSGRFGFGTRNNGAGFDNLQVSVPVDSTAPTAPLNPAVSNVTANQAVTKWVASTDNVAVTGYNVYLNGTKVGTTTATSYTFTGLSPLKSYSYAIAAFDAAGNTSTSTPGTFTTVFVHPGILLDRSQLDYVKSKITAGAAPWSAAFTKTKASKYASSTYTAKPVQYVGCGARNNPDEGCTQEMDDAIAAYTQAVLWYYTGNQAYAQKSIQIMDAWSSVLKDHKFDTTTYTNGLLQAAWVGETFTRAAEIIRYTNAGWTSTGITRFESMLNNAFLPRVINGWKGGNSNWLTSMADATISIGVFTNNANTFNSGVASWRAVVPSSVYLKTDGANPVSSPGMNYTATANKQHWYNPTSYIDGLGQETCRDISHTVMGLEGLVYAAETARIQGYDLYSEQKTRLVAAYELHAKYLNQYLSGSAVTNWVCPSPLVVGGSMYGLGFEKAYNAYANRQGVAMPNTKALLGRLRPTPAALHMDWETLTTPAQ